MALSASSVFEIQTGGTDTNGGGFVTGAAGTDYSLVAGKRVATGADDSTTDAVAVGTTAITSATAVFGTTIVGNIIYLQGGTGVLAAGWYQVTSRTNTTTIAVDRNVAAGTGITMNIGGALATPGMAGGVGLVASNTIYIKAGTYTIASASTNVATGCFSSSLQGLIITGYNTTRGDLGTAPLLQASGISTFVILTASGTDSAITNISVDGATLTSSRGIVLRGFGFNCTALNCTNNGFVETSNAVFNRCVATGCTTQVAFPSGHFIDCIAADGTVTGFILNSRTAIRCIADSNSGATSDGFTMQTGSGALVSNCVAYGNGRDGFRFDDDQMVLENCIAESNTGFGVNNTNRNSCLQINNACFSNTAGNVNTGTGKGNLTLGAVTGSASFFTNAASQDFSLNNTAGAGAAARAAGYPGLLPVGGTGYPDIGVLQHADPISSGGASVAIFGG